MVGNPFQVGGPVTGAHFTDRAEEVRRVVSALREPSRLLVYGPRRMGKSSTMTKAVDRVTTEGVLVGWADFSTATALTDVSNRLLRSFSGALQSLPERILELARRIRPSVSITHDPATGAPVLSLAMEVRQAGVEDQRGAFESVLDQIEELAGSRAGPVALVFDEFQDILEIGGERADWFLRGIMQRHHHVSYVCAGSRESLIHEMLDRKRAFYKHFQLLHLDPIEEGHLSQWIEDRMRSAGVDPRGAGPSILSLAGPRTQDRLHLAREVFAAAAARGHVDAADLEAAYDAIVRSEAPIYLALWSSLSAAQQNALRAVAAAPEKLYSAEVTTRFGLSSSSSMARAIEALVAKGILVRAEGDTAFDNPFLRGWVERELLPDIQGG